ncbi:GNAT family N-acetyltransferase [Microbacterium betulae]|uniref:GNAT family N-acetyltransferase n=1 Tax=Microbacterium betulae TaxID=2981139 RepID=A0AA97FIX7_9MICO|nr:GNAT family N-acetyltransferase [Microbacterium sp. AB]WOF23788.1 GNAT family N-acetyltransferase [Microbacterium sp. AB]
MTIDIRADDLSDPATQALAAVHLAGMHAGSPAESVHALDLDGLRDPSVTPWSAWIRGEIAGIGALKELDARRGELKSFRTAETHLGRGVARALLRHVIAAAADRGMTSLWLETGSDEAFLPARRLYASEGFVECGPFEGYAADPLSTFMSRTV